MAQTFESIMNYPVMDAEGAKKALEEAVKIVKANLPKYTDHFQSSNSFDGFYEATENVDGQQASGQALSGWLMNLPETRHSVRQQKYR